ncbi:MAG: gamma carbonic anhydrase family protein [Sulfuriferula sp.]
MRQPTPPLQTFLGHTPQIDERAWIHGSANVIGDVNVGEDSSVWCGAVIRGDVNHIRIGARTNIQDNSVLHVSHKTDKNPLGAPLVVGDDVTVGHGVILHGCLIGNACLIGMGSLIMDKAVIEPEVLIGAGSLVAENNVLRSGFLYLGRPAQAIRPLRAEEIDYLYYSAQHYVQLSRHYRAPLATTGT